MSKKKGGLIAGLLVGAGLGVLFAPKKGSETRKDLANKINELYEKVKTIEFADVKESISNKIEELKAELKDLDKEKIEAIARKKAESIKKKAEELYKIAKEKGTPILQKAADEVRSKTIEVLNNTVKKLEDGKNEEEKPAKKNSGSKKA